VSIRVGSIIAALGIWWLFSLAMTSTLMPDPVETFATLWGNVAGGHVTKDLLITLFRVLGGLALAMLIGVAVGVTMGMFKKAEKVLDTWVVIAMAIPSLCYALVCFILIGLNETATITAIAITAAPSIAINVWEGVKNIDTRLMSMARVFETSPLRLFTKVILPQILPYLVASTRFGLGIVWKITVFTELIGRPNGVGFKLFYWYQLADMKQVLAWTLLFTIVMLLLEFIVLKPVESRLFAWRPKVSS
jgi:NitT/TauT family transport system permease protein